MSRKLTTQNNLSYQINDDRRQSDIHEKNRYYELKITENTNQSEHETADSRCRKYDEIIEEKAEIITDLKKRIAQLDIENIDMHRHIIRIINSKLKIESESDETDLVSRSSKIDLINNNKTKRDKKIHGKKNFIMKIDLSQEFPS